MAQGIQDFYYHAQNRGFARDYQMRVTQLGDSALGDHDLVFIKTASLPSRKIVTHEVPFSGLKFNVPGTVLYDGSSSWPVTFYATGDYGIRDELERMSLDRFDEQEKGPMGRGGVADLSLPGVESVVQLDLINDKLQIIRTYYLIGAFIVDVGEVQYNTTGSGDILEISASFAYQYWTRSPRLREEGLFGKIANFADSVRNISGAIGGASRGLGGIFG